MRHNVPAPRDGQIPDRDVTGPIRPTADDAAADRATASGTAVDGAASTSALAVSPGGNGPGADRSDTVGPGAVRTDLEGTDAGGTAPGGTAPGGTAPDSAAPDRADVEGTGGSRAGRRWPDAVIVVVLLVLSWRAVDALHTGWARPMWFDEMWRAWTASVPTGQVWSQLSASAGPPSALGWLAAVRGTFELFGWHAEVARYVSIAALTGLAAATYLLARTVLGRLAAVCCGLLTGFGGQVLNQGTELKPYVPEMLVTVAIVGIWVTAPRSGARVGATRSRLLRFDAVGVLGVCALPAPFVVVPLALADILSGPAPRDGSGDGSSAGSSGRPLGRVGGWFTRRVRVCLETLVAIVPVAAHSVFFVGPQSELRSAAYWDPNFAAGRGLSGALRFGVTQVHLIASDFPPYVTNVRSSLHGWHGELFADGLRALPWVVAAAWLLGTWALRRTHRGRLLLAVAVGAEVGMFGASAARFWPFGPVRTNLFLIPVLMVVAAAGITELARLLRRGLPRWAGFAAAAVPVTVAIVVTAVVASDSFHWFEGRQSGARYGDQMAALTLDIRGQLDAGDLAVVGTHMVHYNFLYQMEYSQDGGARVTSLPRISRRDVVLVHEYGDGSAAAAVSARTRAQRPGQIFLVTPVFAGPAGFALELTELRRVGYCRIAPGQDYNFTAVLTVLRPCGT